MRRQKIKFQNSLFYQSKACINGALTKLESQKLWKFCTSKPNVILIARGDVEHFTAAAVIYLLLHTAVKTNLYGQHVVCVFN